MADHQENSPSPSPSSHHKVYTWQVGDSTFTARPTLGARLQSWSFGKAGDLRTLLYWPETEPEDTPYHKVRGGNPILFPFAGRTFADGRIGWWRDPAGEIRAMPMHGFARESRFTMEDLDATGFTACLQPDAAAFSAYPFRYEFRVGYAFRSSGFSVRLALRNLDKTPLPWSAGHHFYFQIPWIPGSLRQDYLLHLHPGRAWRHAPDGTLSAAIFPPGPWSLDDPELVDRIHDQLRIPSVQCQRKGGYEVLRVTTEESSAFSGEHAFVTWTAGPEEPYYCLEPWMGPPNSPSTGKGLHWVAPGEERTYDVAVAFEPNGGGVG